MWKRLLRLWAVVRVDARIAWHALRHPRAPRWFRLGCAALALYLVSPVDLIPDALPVLGISDDLVLIPLLMRWLLGRLPAEVLDEARRQAGSPARGARMPFVERVD